MIRLALHLVVAPTLRWLLEQADRVPCAWANETDEGEL